MTWSFLSPRAGQAQKQPVDNSTDKIFVEPNTRGGWSMRFDGEPVESQIGNYATPQDAKRIAEANCSTVEIVMPKTIPQGVQAIPSKSLDARLLELASPNN